MDIQNLSPQIKPKAKLFDPLLFFITLSLALLVGFWSSRVITPKQGIPSLIGEPDVVSLSNGSIEDIKPGVVYGQTGKSFSDSATGALEQGSINGEGTHILVRPGGNSQRVSLTSSAVDLDLFVGKNVEVKGETNASNKTGWLMDVGTIKITE